ncbi:hypothetical protein DXF87_26665, partial [Enterobacter roggenkampii]
PRTAGAGAQAMIKSTPETVGGTATVPGRVLPGGPPRDFWVLGVFGGGPPKIAPHKNGGMASGPAEKKTGGF